MSFANKKIYKAKGQVATDLENTVAGAFLDLEITSKDLKADLRDLYITAAKEVDVDQNTKAIVIFVPFRLHRRFKKIQARLMRELEKKFSGKHVCFIAQRTILSKAHARKNKGALRPRSRTLTSVQDSILEDIVFPTQIVGKRIRFRLDGSKILKVHLDPNDQKEVDYKLKTFAAVYKAFTNKDVEFSFPDKAL
mmetsp:Transcript_45857/g.97826  ORF Transcript_45857/g.97826 Transcript_45857/m.97826 type:complete len:194 (-) Transcript_45857:117-698(-)|eukprot:CAMPEP_0183351408 /NCGR_PEP_ID=MMETSP0164_2-20130417/24597_1 /TAXON_ID=221442 /ORGANISM="Coccolithus pelagicus ssp braarudi, Strain PLY182g" /LENGTH=193 /DNA_ID=CAMNT_0025523581 /DNA_START=45 /DNA_END=626 /DNA_ORIENTATION=+